MRQEVNGGSGSIARGIIAVSMMAATGMGTANGQPVPIPSFAGPYEFSAPAEPGVLAATPHGFDLVGTGTSQVPDGFAEVAVADEVGGVVQVYRNQNLWDSLTPQLSLEPWYLVDVFDDLGITTDLSGTDRITQIQLVDMTGDLIPDLVVSAFSQETVGSELVQYGHIAVFQATTDPVFTDRVTGFVYRSDLVLDLPATGFTVADYNKDGRPDVLASCVNADGDPSLDAARVFVARNDVDGAGAGVLYRLSDQGYPSTFHPSTSVVAGEFSLVHLFPGSGTTLDFVTFGGSAAPESGDGPLAVGRGTGTGSFGFHVSSKQGTDCGGADIPGLSYGADLILDDLKPLVLFDPFASADQSLATNISSSALRIIHNRPKTGAFYHLCNGSGAADYYVVDNCSTGGVPPIPPSAQTASYLTSGNLNGDTYDDLVHLSPSNAKATFLLGRGTPDANNRILQYICGSPLYELTDHDGGISGDSDYDKAICADLDNDGFDEIIISRYSRQSMNPNTWSFFVYHNTTGPSE